MPEVTGASTPSPTPLPVTTSGRVATALPPEVVRAIQNLGKPKTIVPPLSPSDTAAILRARAATFDVVHNFQRGDLVQWKAGMKNRIKPDLGQPAIVMEVLAEPLFHAGAQPGSQLFREPLDILLGIINSEDGAFLIFHFDKRRFEPFSQR
jgi:hypothetical protein